MPNEFSTKFDDFYKHDRDIKLLYNPFIVDANKVNKNVQMETIEFQSYTLKFSLQVFLFKFYLLLF